MHKHFKLRNIIILECWNWAKDEPCQVRFWHLHIAMVKTFMCGHLCMMAVCTINIYKMVAIFQFFHNGQCSYAISVDTQKTGDPNFGVGNLEFFCTINIYKMVAIFLFFHNGLYWYSISVDTCKTGDPNFGGSLIWNFSVWLIFMKWWPFFNFFIMADASIPLILRELETQIFHWLSFPNFQLVQFSLSPILGSISTLMCGYA